MKKYFQLISAITLFTTLLSSCSKEVLFGEGPVVTQTRPLTNFRGVATAIPGQVNFKVDPVFKVEIVAQQNVLDVMRTDIHNGILYIDFRYNVRVKRHEDIVINITAPSADYLSVSGVGNIVTAGEIIVPNMAIDIAGSGNIAVEKATVTGKIDARISGSGNISVASGAAKTEDFEISGSGNMEVSNVPAESAETHISGSGDIRLNLSQSLNAYISGSGSVYYKGHPTVSTHISGSGTVKPI